MMRYVNAEKAAGGSLLGADMHVQALQNLSSLLLNNKGYKEAEVFLR